LKVKNIVYSLFEDRLSRRQRLPGEQLVSSEGALLHQPAVNNILPQAESVNMAFDDGATVENTEPEEDSVNKGTRSMALRIEKPKNAKGTTPAYGHPSTEGNNRCRIRTTQWLYCTVVSKS